MGWEDSGNKGNFIVRQGTDDGERKRDRRNRQLFVGLYNMVGLNDPSCS